MIKMFNSFHSVESTASLSHMHFMVTMFITPTIQGWCLQGHCQNAERDGRDQQPDQPEDPGGEGVGLYKIIVWR